MIGIPILFTLMFTYLFGGALAGSTRVYLRFLLPGTRVLAVVLVTVYAGVTLSTDVATGAFDRYVVAAALGLMAGTPSAGQVVWALVAAGALAAVFAPLTMRLYRR